MEEPVTIIDRDVLKTLSVETRMDILKELSEGDRTPSDLGKRLEKSDSTIVGHLDNLCKVGLVKKIEQPGKKWIFYTLTERGYGIVSSKKRRLIIILSTSILAIAGSGFSFMRHFLQPQHFGMLEKTADIPPELYTNEAVSTVASTTSPVFLYLGIGLAAIGFIGLGFYLYQKSKNKRRKLYEGF
jgi:DNA-binding transcriptional ArsR family regulator